MYIIERRCPHSYRHFYDTLCSLPKKLCVSVCLCVCLLVLIRRGSHCFERSCPVSLFLFLSPVDTAHNNCVQYLQVREREGGEKGGGRKGSRNRGEKMYVHDKEMMYVHNRKKMSA